MSGSKILLLLNAELSHEGIGALFSDVEAICMAELSYCNYMQMAFARKAISVLAIQLPLHNDDLAAILEHYKENYPNGTVLYISLSDFGKKAVFNPQGYIQHHHWKITPTELQLIRYLAAGKKAAEMAELTGLSVRTIETYIRNLLQKLDVHNRPQLIHFAHINGFLF